jgi:uncharacterized protein (DUF433 family)
MKPLVELTVPLPDVLEEMGGEYRVKGSRITLYHILSAHNEHWIGPHAMVFYYPTLSLDEIEKVLEFYHANQAAVDDFFRRYKAVLDQQRATGNQLDVEGLRRRFEAMRAAARTKAAVNGQASHPGVAPAESRPASS